MKNKRDWLARQLSRIGLFDRYFTRQERNARKSGKSVEIITEIKSATRLWGPLGCVEIETPEGRMYKLQGLDNDEFFDFMQKNLEKPMVLSYQKMNMRLTDWSLSLDCFLYNAGRAARGLTGRNENYGTPKKYLEINKAELFSEVAGRFKGMNI